MDEFTGTRGNQITSFDEPYSRKLHTTSVESARRLFDITLVKVSCAGSMPPSHSGGAIANKTCWSRADQIP